MNVLNVIFFQKKILVTRKTYAISGCGVTQFGVDNGMCYDYLGLICWANTTCSYDFKFCAIALVK